MQENVVLQILTTLTETEIYYLELIIKIQVYASHE